ncbi:hypothetical protein F7725_019431, partial [Dissostichus mawsoni]
MRRSNSVCFVSAQNGKIDMTFFTHDCFHFTIKGHEELAKGLWNNMVNNESHCLFLTRQEEHPYIFTRPLAAHSGHPPLQSATLSQAALLLLLLLLTALACLP